MNWQEVCENPNLKNLPFKIELNQWGQILMSPAKVYHSRYQGKIIKYLNSLIAEGEAFPECAIKTKKGTKVPDVVWASPELCKKLDHEDESPLAPEICIEVLSPNNPTEEMEEKMLLYFEEGAKEVWFCDEHGKMNFFTPQGNSIQSDFVPDFPSLIKIYD